MTFARLLMAAVTLLGCGDDDDPVVPQDAGVDAARDDAGGQDAGQHVSAIEWESCDDFECASLDVPIDHRDPEGPSLPMALLRRPASAPGDRVGTLVVNFAGESLSAARQTFPMLALLASDVTDVFDLVAFDPRGWGQSAPVDCVGDDVLEALFESDLTPDDAADWTASMQLVEALSDGCAAQAGDLVPFLDSESIARDMEMLRAAMGDDQLSFLGLSWGSLFGQSYATLFPDRVRAFVLDSPVAPAADAVEFVGWQAVASDVELGRFLAACGADATCAFHGGEGETAARDAFDALLEAAEAAPIAAGDDSLTASLLQVGTVALLRNGDAEVLASALADAAAGDGAALFDAARGMLGRSEDGTWNDFLEVFEASVLQELGCPAGYDLAAAQATSAALADAAPRLGAMASSVAMLCAAWTVERPTPRLPVDASEAPPLLVLAGLHDQSTPYEHVPRLLDALGNDSHLVTWEGTGHVVSSRTMCTIAATVEFVLDPTSPPAVDTCPAD